MDYFQFIKDYEFIEKHLETIVPIYKKIYDLDRWSYLGIDFTQDEPAFRDDGILIYFDKYYSGDNDYERFRVPFEFFSFMDHQIEEELVRRIDEQRSIETKKQLEKLEKERLEKEAALKIREEAEYKRYLQLKEKYEK